MKIFILMTVMGLLGQVFLLEARETVFQYQDPAFYLDQTADQPVPGTPTLNQRQKVDPPPQPRTNSPAIPTTRPNK